MNDKPSLVSPDRPRGIVVRKSAMSFAVMPSPSRHAWRSFCREPKMGAVERAWQAKLERHAQYAGTR